MASSTRPALGVLAATLATAAAQGPWCSSAPQSGWGICNTSWAIDDRSADIVSRISLNDKFQALASSTPALNSIGLPAYNWWSEVSAATAGTEENGKEKGGN
jgi:hypothetical protein